MDDEWLPHLYGRPFTNNELADKQVVRQVLCESFLQQFIVPEAIVLDVGAGACEFINASKAGRKIAVDLNPHTKQRASCQVEVLACSSADLSSLDNSSIDTIFSSNFFEHLPTKNELPLTLAECRRVGRLGARIIVIMPDLPCVPGRYRDYLDHQIPLTHRSLVEALAVASFEAELIVPRFLPYTVKSARLPVSKALVRTYLRCRPIWWVMGRQMLVIARGVTLAHLVAQPGFSRSKKVCRPPPGPEPSSA